MNYKSKYNFIILLMLSIMFIIEPVLALDIENAGMTIINGSGGNTYSRKVATSIGIYSKNGVLPGVHKYSGTYAGVAYNVLEVDVTDTNGTFLQVDYAGYNKTDDMPKNLNNFYDGTLTKDDEYYWVGAINAGFFTASSSANDYGYPTGAVKKNGSWMTYSPKDKSYTWDTTPSYGTGFVTAYFNKNKEFKLIYNGWKSGAFYKYAYDPSPNSWDYGEHVNYSEGVSGAYTLMVNGDSTIHWGKDDYTGTNFWNYAGTAVTLFGQKANGNYLLVTTEGTLNATNQVGLMTELGSVNGIRFDGGGSTQMVYDKGLVLNHFYFGKDNNVIYQGSELDTSDIYFELYMEDGSYYLAFDKDVPQVEYSFYDMNNKLVEDITKSEIGEYWLKVEMNGLEQLGKINVVEAVEPIKEYNVVFDYNDGKTENVKVSVKDGESIQKPSNPVRDGYTFIEWQRDNTAYDFNAGVTEDIILKAKYELIIPDIEKTSGYNVNDFYIELDTGIISNTLSLGLSDIYDVKVYSNQYIEKTDKTIATSDIIQIKLDDVLVDEYIVVVKGDVTGDGVINVADVGKLYQYLRGKITMNECHVLSGDIVNDDNILITDVGKLYQFIKGKINSL